MYCVPACKACREAGSCPKGELPASRVPAPKSRRRSRVLYAVKEVMIEKERAAYIDLTCGHTTTYEAQLFYSVWAPRKAIYYCDKCHRDVEMRKKPKPELL